MSLFVTNTTTNTTNTTTSTLYLIPEVHIEGEVHEELIDFLDRQNIKGNFHKDRLSSILRPDSSVVTNLRESGK